ncbi:hypothetical protein DH2020_046907 [Rehmannia glutinosa]|uniref:VASt domain-containing protein n=1 Tax=Rehmannia glutinosa TaxID=99300 RepID=A0ABR0UBK7_REHGL
MVDPTPASAPPTSQSMDSHNSSRPYPGDSPSASPTHDAPDRSPVSTPSPSRQLDPQPSRVEEYRQLFRLPPDEALIQDFNCALQENFLLQGHMYLFVHCICFYSNLFGFETKKIIPFREITSVRRAKAVAVFPTAIEIIAAEKKYFFTSFLFDEAFKLINEGWLQHSNGCQEITDQQEPKPDISIQENGSSTVEVEVSGSSRQSVDESDIIERDKFVPILEESKHFGDVEPEIVSTSSIMEVMEEANPEAAPIIECSSSAKSSAWEFEDTDAPGVPEGYIKVAESKFPVQDLVAVKRFRNIEFTGTGKFLLSLGISILMINYTDPAAFPIISRTAVPYSLPAQFYHASHLIVDTSQEINDVPYGDYFRVEGRWDVEKVDNESKPGCILRVYTNVAFSKKTMWKGKIVQSTVEECREAYAIWLDLVPLLSFLTNLISNEQVRLKKLENTQQQCVEYKTSDVRISETIPVVKDMNRVNDPPQGNVGEASVGSLLRDTFTKVSTSLKYQNTSSLLLVISIAIILLLMQISILVLLSRPQRIHMIPQADCMNRMSENRGEALALLNKQIKYLKEEMNFVETMLEKMQNEHTQLKAKLKDLELFRNQQKF